MAHDTHHELLAFHPSDLWICMQIADTLQHMRDSDLRLHDLISLSPHAMCCLCNVCSKGQLQAGPCVAAFVTHMHQTLPAMIEYGN